MRIPLLMIFATLLSLSCDAWYAVHLKVTDNPFAESQIVSLNVFRADTAKPIAGVLVSEYFLASQDSGAHIANIRDSRYTDSTGYTFFVGGFGSRKHYGAIVAMKDGFRPDTVYFSSDNADTTFIIFKLERQ